MDFMANKMNLIENQQLWFDTVLSYRTRVEKNALGDMIRHIRDNVSALDLKITDDVVVSISEEITEPNKTILGVEVIVPVDRQLESNCHYVFKPHFRLTNAVLMKFNCKASDLVNKRDNLYRYAYEQHYLPNSEVYFSVKHIDEDEMIADAYLGVNGNLL